MSVYYTWNVYIKNGSFFFFCMALMSFIQSFFSKFSFRLYTQLDKNLATDVVSMWKADFFKIIKLTYTVQVNGPFSLIKSEYTESSFFCMKSIWFYFSFPCLDHYFTVAYSLNLSENPLKYFLNKFLASCKIFFHINH